MCVLDGLLKKLYIKRKVITNGNPKRFYGINLEDYNRLYTQQDGKCAICKNWEEVLSVDHCHDTERVRALLCGTCNFGLGAFKDKIELLRKAIEYLEKYNGSND